MLTNHVPFIYFMAFNKSGIRHRFYTIGDIFEHVAFLKQDKSDFTVEVYIDDTFKGIHVLGDYATLEPKM